ncbi:MAG: PASTA domain-containing protein [Erysipelotrichaceae bacterium]|nr:PASTA domain-containing protein [Erysipelotrichaceae bacterium]
MKFFRNKLNIVLSVVLVLLIGLGVFLGIKFFTKPAVTAVDFSTMNETEVVNWANENNVSDLIEFEHEYDEVIEKGKVVYQSVKAGDEITDKVLIIISDGPDESNLIVIPVDTLNTKESFDVWAKDKGLINIKYEVVTNSDKDEGSIVSIEPTKVKKDDLVTVKYVSSKNIEVPDFSYMSDDEITKWSDENGVKVSYTKKASKLEKGSFVEQSVKPGEKVAKGDSITIYVSTGVSDEKQAYIDPTKYLGTKEEDFLKELKELGFKNVVMIEEINSTKFDEGTICYYLPDGTQNFDTKIEYKVSLGKDGKPSESAVIDETKYLGAKEEDFLKDLKELGFTNVVKLEEVKSAKYDAGTICYYLPDGKQKLDTKIEYKVSVGKDGTPSSDKTATIDPYGYMGKTEEEFLKALKELGFTKITKVEETTSTKYKEGTICYYLPDGKQKLDTEIKYKVVKSTKNETTDKTATIDPYGYLGKTEDEFVKALKALGFTNIVKIGEDTNSKYANGTICYYLPDGKQKLDTKIEYKISSKKTETETPKEEKVTIPTISANPCGGSTASCSLNGLNYSVTFENSSTVDEGKVISMSPSTGTSVNRNSTVSVKVSKGKGTKFISLPADYRSNAPTDNDVSKTKTYVQSVLGDFDLTITTSTNKDYGVGYIVSVSVNGNSAYNEGYYPLDTKVSVVISSGH